MDARDRSRLARLRGARWTGDDALWVLGLAEREGVALGRLAREHGLQAQRLYWWRSRLGPAKAPEPGRLIPIELVGDEPGAEGSPAAPPSSGVVLETTAGHRLHLAAGFDPEALLQVLAVLDARC